MTDQSPPIPHIPVLIIGGGQAGLSVSWYLCQTGIDHIVLEKHRRFQSWRVNRWDSFCLVTPNWQCRLPGFPYAGDDPDGFMLRNEIVEYLDGFAGSFNPPLRENVTVTRVTPLPDGSYRVETTDGTWIAGQVVVATGGYDNPIVPPYASAIDPSITQMHSVDYRRPAQLPKGGTLIVGTGQSGVQVMEDFQRAGRDVHLAVGPAPRSPRKYRGRDATDWLYDMGHYAMTIDKHPDPVAAATKTNHYLSGRDGGSSRRTHWHRVAPAAVFGDPADFVPRSGDRGAAFRHRHHDFGLRAAWPRQAKQRHPPRPACRSSRRGPDDPARGSELRGAGRSDSTEGTGRTGVRTSWICLYPLPDDRFQRGRAIVLRQLHRAGGLRRMGIAAKSAGHFLLEREIVFLGNVDPGTSLRACLIAQSDADHEMRLADSQGRLLAVIRTTKLPTSGVDVNSATAPRQNPGTGRVRRQ